MSAAPRFDPSLGYAGLRMTADEYLALGETPERYELIDGVVVMSPSPFPRHNELVAEVVRQLGNFSVETTPLRIFPDSDLDVGPSLVYRPDVSVYLADRLQAQELRRLSTPPDLVVEVLSLSTRALDLVTKRDDYAAFGVREYWVIDPKTARVRRWTRRADGTPAESDPGLNDVASAAVPGFVLDVSKLRRFAE
jgi:Uma2 family endonuclease